MKQSTILLYMECLHSMALSRGTMCSSTASRTGLSQRHWSLLLKTFILKPKLPIVKDPHKNLMLLGLLVALCLPLWGNKDGIARILPSGFCVCLEIICALCILWLLIIVPHHLLEYWIWLTRMLEGTKWMNNDLADGFSALSRSPAIFPCVSCLAFCSSWLGPLMPLRHQSCYFVLYQQWPLLHL